MTYFFGFAQANGTIDPMLMAIAISSGISVGGYAPTSLFGIVGYRVEREAGLVPLAVPLATSGAVSGWAPIGALCVCASIVDISPFSTTGATLVASAPADERARVRAVAHQRRLLARRRVGCGTIPECPTSPTPA